VSNDRARTSGLQGVNFGFEESNAYLVLHN